MKSRGFVKALLLIAALIGAFYAGMRTQAYLMKTSVWTWRRQESGKLSDLRD